MDVYNIVLKCTQWNKDPGLGTHEDPTLLCILYTSQYSILVRGTSARSLAWLIHFSPHQLEIISASEKSV